MTRSFASYCPEMPNYGPLDPMADVFRMGNQYMRRQEYLSNADEITFSLNGSDFYAPVRKAAPAA